MTLDEEFYCAKCNWFVYGSKLVAIMPRCPRCGLYTRPAVPEDAIRAMEQVQEDKARDIQYSRSQAIELREKFHQNYPGIARCQYNPENRRPDRHLNQMCSECHITLREPCERSYCDVCATMHDAVRQQPGLAAAQLAWEAENRKLILLKQKLMRD